MSVRLHRRACPRTRMAAEGHGLCFDVFADKLDVGRETS